MKFLSNMVYGVLFTVLVIGIFIVRGWDSINEDDISRQEVLVSSMSFETSDYSVNGMTVYASARMQNTSELDITDYDAELTVYDCPRATARLPECRRLGQADTDQGDTIPIRSGLPAMFEYPFVIPRVAKPSGVMVFDLQFDNFQGSKS